MHRKHRSSHRHILLRSTNQFSAIFLHVSSILTIIVHRKHPQNCTEWYEILDNTHTRSRALLRNTKGFLFLRSIWAKRHVIYGHSGKGFQLCIARGKQYVWIRNGTGFLYPSVCHGGKPCDNHFPTVAFIPSLKMKISNLLEGFRKFFSVWCYRINVPLYRVIQEEISVLWEVRV